MSTRANVRWGLPPKLSQHGLSTGTTGLGFGFLWWCFFGGGGGGGAGMTVTSVGFVSSFPDGWLGRTTSHAAASPAASSTATAAPTRSHFFMRGRRDNQPTG